MSEALKLQWPDKDSNLLSMDVPETFARISSIIGANAAVAFHLHCGGMMLQLPRERPTEDGFLTGILGKDHLIAIGQEFCGGRLELPVLDPFLMRHFRAQGLSQNHIAYIMRRPRRSVQRWVNEKDSRKKDR